MAGSIEDIFLSCSEPKRNVVEPSLVSVGTATISIVVVIVVGGVYKMCDSRLLCTGVASGLARALRMHVG